MSVSISDFSGSVVKAGGGRWTGPALLALAGAGAIAFFWPGLASLTRAWATPEYSHGPLIPLISLFLFLREMRHVPPAPVSPRERVPGVLVVALGLLVGFAGHLTQIDQIVTYGMIVWIAGVVLVCFGARRGALFWPSVLHLVFMLPLPQIVYWQVSSYLQTISSQLGVWMITLMGVPVYLDGNIIDLGVYKLQVAEACSGLRYLFPMLSFSYVFALLYQGPLWHKAVLLLAAAPITVAMNSFRIGVIGILVDNFGISHAEGFLHLFEGWIIFVSCVLILFGIAAGLQRLTRTPKRLSETLDIEFTGLRDELARVARVVPAAALAVAAIGTGGVAAAVMFSPEREAVRVARDPFVLFPRRIGDWDGHVNPVLDAQIERVLGADDYHSATFSRVDESQPIDLFMGFYYNQMDGTGIHSPEVCIPSGGWEVSAWRPITIDVAGEAPIRANRAVIQRGAARQLVYYWFELRGRRVAGDFEAKIVNLADSLSYGRSDGALVRLITPMRDGEDGAEADARLQRFVTEMAPLLPRFVPH